MNRNNKNIIKRKKTFLKSFIKVLLREYYLKYYRLLTNRIRMLPDFLIIGAPRSGTTSLYNYLIKHPFIKKAFKKEVHFFNRNFNKSISWYRAFFPSRFYKFFYESVLKRDFITGEATPDYSIQPLAPKRIFSLLSNIKLILLLRNPVDRAYSAHYNNVQRKLEIMTFEAAIEKEKELIKRNKIYGGKYLTKSNYQKDSFLASGIYIEYIKKWMEVFPKEQILIIKSEDFFENPKKTLDRICEFLEIPNLIVTEYKIYHYRNKPILSNKTRRNLIDFYKPYNLLLYQYLGINFNWDS